MQSEKSRKSPANEGFTKSNLAIESSDDPDKHYVVAQENILYSAIWVENQNDKKYWVYFGRNWLQFDSRVWQLTQAASKYDQKIFKINGSGETRALH